MPEALRYVVLALEVALAVPLAYLFALSIAAVVSDVLLRMRRSSRRTVPPSRLPRFAVLIPAHNEAAVITQVLASVAALDYPRSAVRAIVVADNCSDETAALARAAGATVYERFDDERRAKGYALQWLLEQLERDALTFDAYVIVDADTTLSPNLPLAFAERLAAGDAVMQCQYVVLNGAASRASGLRAIAFALFNHLRPLGRSLLGLSAGLKGNGMCFSRAVLLRHGWGAYSLAEDVEHHATLLRAGVRVRYVPWARVAAEMPVTLHAAQSQQSRWERGRLALLRRCALPLLGAFVRRGDPALLDAALEILVPPLSVLAGLLVLVSLAALVIAWPLTTAGAGVLLAACAVYVFAGMVVSRLPPRTWLALVAAPVFILWKCWIYAAALLRRNPQGWVRTARVAEQPVEVGATRRR